MKRDMDLVREILLTTEASGESPLGWVKLEFENWPLKEVSYHVVLLAEARMIEMQDLCNMGPDGYDYKPKRLTWYGHEFLDTIRDDDIWQKTRAGAEKVGGISIELFAALAKGLVKQKVKKHTGVDLEF